METAILEEYPWVPGDSVSSVSGARSLAINVENRYENENWKDDHFSKVFWSQKEI